MNKVFNLLFILLTGVFVASCSKDSGSGSVALRDYTEQYAKDIDTLDWFIDNHYMTVTPDFDVTFTPITSDTPGTSIRNQTEFPLQFKMVEKENHGVTYKVYYINFREGANRRPSSVDSVHVSYRGVLVNTNQFDSAPNPMWFSLNGVVPGWAQIVPMFKTGFYTDTGGPNPITFSDFGTGVMFLPSGLGYFGQQRANIPVYSPLIFSFKLYELRYTDQDRDGILSKDEVANPGDDPLEYDLDGDGVPNMSDVDDDGDGVMTKHELHRDTDGNIIFEDCDGDGVPNYLDPDSDGSTCN